MVVSGAAGFGCSAPVRESVFLDRMRFGSMGSVALAPLENLTGNPAAADTVADLLAVTLYQTNRFKVVERGEVVRRMGEKMPALVDRSAARDIGRKLNVDGVIFGTVTEFGPLLDRTTYGQESIIGLHVRLVDSHTGDVVWTAFVNRTTGDAFFTTGQAMSDLAKSAVLDVVNGLIPPAAQGAAP